MVLGGYGVVGEGLRVGQRTSFAHRKLAGARHTSSTNQQQLVVEIVPRGRFKRASWFDTERHSGKERSCGFWRRIAR
jgi:hypothetical protein